MWVIIVNMLEGVFGNATAEKVLLYLENYEEGYAQKIADTFEISLSMTQQQLKRFESSGLISSVKKGNTRIYLWNPSYPFRVELRALLKKAMTFIPEKEKKKYFRQRTRPRRTGKPS